MQFGYLMPLIIIHSLKVFDYPSIVALFLAEGYLLHASITKHTSFKTCSAYISGITVARCKSRAYRKPILPSPSKHEYFVGPLENGIYM